MYSLALADTDGQVTDTYFYDAFGNLLSKTGTTANDFLYTGEQYDISTGFYYLRARYMNPSTGTFTSPDAYAGTIFDPVSLHKYLYANANPVMNRDPSGYFTITEEMSVCAIIGAYSNVTLTLIDMFFQGDDYEGDSADLYKALFSGIISGLIAGALIPLLGAVSLTTAFGCALLIFVVMAVYFGYILKAIAVELTPEGSFFDMSINDQLMFVAGAVFDTLGDALLAPIRTILKIPEAVGFGYDLLVVILENLKGEKTNA